MVAGLSCKKKFISLFIILCNFRAYHAWPQLHMKKYILLFTLLLVSCGSSLGKASETPEVIKVQYTPSTSTWLPVFDSCAQNLLLIIFSERRYPIYFDTDSPIAIRIGESSTNGWTSFQIGKTDILIILNTENPISKLTGLQVKGIFSGKINNWKEINGFDLPIQIWIYPNGDDVQQTFEQLMMNSSPISPKAHIAETPSKMQDEIVNNKNSIGFVARNMNTGNVVEAFSINNIPVIIMTPTIPQYPITEILTCMQK
jgi:hypothetical protein